MKKKVDLLDDSTALMVDHGIIVMMESPSVPPISPIPKSFGNSARSKIF